MKRNQGVSRGIVVILILISFVAGAGVGIGGFIYVTGGDGTPSRNVSEVIAEADSPTSTAMTDAVSATSQDSDTSTNEQSAATSTEASVFVIDPAQSLASFTIHEELRGVPTTVVGTTTELGGTINVNFANPSASTISTIAVNARTLATDNDMRNRTIRSRILESAQDDYEFITFTPTALSNFSADSASVGDTLSFDVTGDLTIKTVTNQATFHATVIVTSDTQISGTATTTVLYPDYGLVIPNAPGVANVTEEVELSLAFVATKQ